MIQNIKTYLKTQNNLNTIFFSNCTEKYKTKYIRHLNVKLLTERTDRWIFKASVHSVSSTDLLSRGLQPRARGVPHSKNKILILNVTIRLIRSWKNIVFKRFVLIANLSRYYNCSDFYRGMRQRCTWLGQFRKNL